MDSKRKPYLINIEGADGTGKHTVSMALKKIFEDKGYKVHVTSFPVYGTASGDLISAFLQGSIIGDSKTSEPVLSSLMYTIDRMIYFTKNATEILDSDIIISDRSYLSNFFYQASKLMPKPDTASPDNASYSMKPDEYPAIQELINYANLFIPLEFGTYPMNCISKSNIYSVYLYHPDFTMNTYLMRKRVATDPTHITDLNENSDYLMGVNAFALRMYSMANHPSYDNQFSKFLAMFPEYYYSLIPCSSSATNLSPEQRLLPPEAIANRIYDDVIEEFKKTSGLSKGMEFKKSIDYGGYLFPYGCTVKYHRTIIPEVPDSNNESTTENRRDS